MASPASMPRSLARLSSLRAAATATSALRPSHPQLFQNLILRSAALRRHASSKQPSDGKPRVLEKPDKFRPPSHAARLPARKRPQYTYGPRLSDEELAAQKTKQYPHMMPPEGSFMHWFLTNRMLHVYIAFSVLISLSFFMFLQNFLHSTPYRDLLPSRSDLLWHPFSSVYQFASVYKMHAEHLSAETAERRRRKVEDVDKRAEYRRAHGLEQEESGLLKGWFGGKKEESAEDVQSPVAKAEVLAEGQAAEGAQQEGFRDFEGRQQRRPVKKWLGIW